MSSKIVAVAGGTGKLGRAIVEELVNHGGYSVLILGREANPEKTKEIGAEILAVDYSDADAIASTLEKNKIDTVISTLGSMFGSDPELALIEGSKKSNVTKRYIPSLWGCRYTSELAAFFPLAHSKIAYLKALEGSSLEYTAVINGFFLDYWGFPKVKSYLGPNPLILDIAGNAAAIPGSGDVPGVFTYSFDIGRFVAALLSVTKWDKESVIIGDKLTWNEFLAIAEEVKGTKFTVAKDDLSTLQQGKITELPSQVALYPFFPKEQLQGFFAAFGIMFEKGFFDFKLEGTLNERYPEIKTKKAKDIVEEAWRA
ncbi:hypothetical protein BKA66DRAFT_444287 [Pyrenochaeta sp. MPI-SDFR-AT-0127]|nr:hypothetical protein BKA66DRAFT_444287 [Pyrenochaeta sp. MPI-SDFR-AT-0127]